VHSYL
jgi:phosphomevalonate kinase